MHLPGAILTWALQGCTYPAARQSWPVSWNKVRAGLSAEDEVSLPSSACWGTNSGLSKNITGKLQSSQQSSQINSIAQSWAAQRNNPHYSHASSQFVSSPPPATYMSGNCDGWSQTALTGVICFTVTARAGLFACKYNLVSFLQLLPRGRLSPTAKHQAHKSKHQNNKRFASTCSWQPQHPAAQTRTSLFHAYRWAYLHLAPVRWQMQSTEQSLKLKSSTQARQSTVSGHDRDSGGFISWWTLPFSMDRMLFRFSSSLPLLNSASWRWGDCSPPAACCLEKRDINMKAEGNGEWMGPSRCESTERNKAWEKGFENRSCRWHLD